MALKLEEIKEKPPIIMVYGEGGLGKSTMGALAPKPIFIYTEDGLCAIKAPRLEKATSYKMFLSQLEQIATEEHDYKTLVIDSVDWLEPLIWSQLCAESNVRNINLALGGYGKGYGASADLFREYTQALDYIRDTRNMMILQIAHAQVKRYENPETEAYDRYQIKLHDKASDVLYEHADFVFFLNTYVTTKKEELGGFTKERKRAIGSSERILYTSERPTARAKARYKIQPEIIFDEQGNYWKTIMDAVPYFNQQ